MPEGSRTDLTVRSKIASNDSTYKEAKQTYCGSSRTQTDQQTFATAVANWHKEKVSLEAQLKELQSDAKSPLKKARREITETIASRRADTASQR
jgi:hypothetical protein